MRDLFSLHLRRLVFDQISPVHPERDIVEVVVVGSGQDSQFLENTNIIYCSLPKIPLTIPPPFTAPFLYDAYEVTDPANLVTDLTWLLPYPTLFPNY